MTTAMSWFALTLLSPLVAIPLALIVGCLLAIAYDIGWSLWRRYRQWKSQ